MVGLLSGCGANSRSIYRNSELDGSDRFITTDAKQRGVLRQRRGTNGSLVTCIEPSPDAFSVFAATASGNVDVVDKVTAAFGYGSAETGANIGLRTQTITVLRDQGYRICEAYANDSISDVDYQQMLRRNQVMTTAVLAIEQLTGAVVGASAAIAASGDLEIDQSAVNAAAEKVATASGDVAKAQAALDEAVAKRNEHRNVVAGLESDFNQAKRAYENEPDDSPDKAALKTAMDNAEKKLNDARQALETEEGNVARRQGELAQETREFEVFEEALRIARMPNHRLRSAMALAGGEGTAAILDVADAVENIVQMAFTKSYLIDFCQMYWSGGIANASPDLGKLCDRILDRFEHVLDHATHYEYGRDSDPPGSGRGGSDALPPIGMMERRAIVAPSIN
jgi:hypothetical protein